MLGVCKKFAGSFGLPWWTYTCSIAFPRNYPFHPPLVHQPAIDNSADVLHLIFINMFAFFFETTMLVYVNEWPPHARAPARCMHADGRASATRQRVHAF